MKEFKEIDFDLRACESGLSDFRTLLDDPSADLSKEDKVLLPFFRERPHLLAAMGLLHGEILSPNRIAWELDLFGDYKCDFVIGDLADRTRPYPYCFIEFENAIPKSLFKRPKDGRRPQFASRFCCGLSQPLDWAHSLNENGGTVAFHERFAADSINWVGVLVCGRSTSLRESERRRISWRQENILVDGRSIRLLTFDDLHDALSRRIGRLKELAARL